jgi:hypothetical protein
MLELILEFVLFEEVNVQLHTGNGCNGTDHEGNRGESETHFEVFEVFRKGL